MLEFVDSDLYFVQDKNNFINPLLQVGSGSGSGSGSSSLVTLTARLIVSLLLIGRHRVQLFRIPFVHLLQCKFCELKFTYVNGLEDHVARVHELQNSLHAQTAFRLTRLLSVCLIISVDLEALT